MSQDQELVKGFMASLSGPRWAQRHVHLPFRSDYALSHIELLGRRDEPLSSADSHISALGIGKLYLLAFYSPGPSNFKDFDAAAKARGLVKVWPLCWRLWPFPKRRLHLPADLVLDDDRRMKWNSFHHGWISGDSGTW